MNTGELLDHVANHMLDDRATLLAGENDELFSDATVVRYLNDAQNKLARDAMVIEDFETAAICEIDLTENNQFFALHKSILQVKAARLSDTDVDLLRVGYDDARLLPNHHAYEPDYWDVNVSYTDTPGRPARYSTDMGTRKLRLDRPVDAATALLTLNLTVVRLPLTPLTTADPNASPEVPEEFHLDLCLYAAGSCLKNTADIDAELRSLGRQMVNDFEDKVASAKRDKQRLQQRRPRFRFRGWVNGDRFGR